MDTTNNTTGQRSPAAPPSVEAIERIVDIMMSDSVKGAAGEIISATGCPAEDAYLTLIRDRLHSDLRG